jgi:hypothetical protein
VYLRQPEDTTTLVTLPKNVARLKGLNMSSIQLFAWGGTVPEPALMVAAFADSSRIGSTTSAGT